MTTVLPQREVVRAAFPQGVATVRQLVDLFLEEYQTPPQELILDATDAPLHGDQEGRFFTAIATATAICRFTCSAVGTYWRPSFGARTLMPRPAP